MDRNFYLHLGIIGYLYTYLYLLPVLYKINNNKLIKKLIKTITAIKVKKLFLNNPTITLKTHKKNK